MDRGLEEIKKENQSSPIKKNDGGLKVRYLSWTSLLYGGATVDRNERRRLV